MTTNKDAIDSRYKMRLSGKEYVTYPGLLDAAHRAGLTNIEVEILQYPHAENGGTAVVKAKAYFNADGKPIRCFEEIGDANAQNTNKQVGLHGIRMAATRAKARALRDALNIEGAAFEELGGGDELEATAVSAVQRSSAPAKAVEVGDNDPVTEDQIQRMLAQAQRLGWEPSALTPLIGERYGKAKGGELTAKEATDFLAYLVGLKPQAAA